MRQGTHWLKHAAGADANLQSAGLASQLPAASCVLVVKGCTAEGKEGQLFVSSPAGQPMGVGAHAQARRRPVLALLARSGVLETESASDGPPVPGLGSRRSLGVLAMYATGHAE